MKQGVEAFLAWPPIREIPHATARGVLLYTALLVGFVVLERALGKNITRYRSRHVAIDYLYCIFYNGGYFAAIYYPLLKGTEWIGTRWKVGVLSELPLIVSIPLFYIVADFSFYWAHRVLHTKYFWPFHSIHHSQTELSVLTTARFHVVDVIVLTLFTGIPAAVLGFPAEVQLVTWVLMLQDKMEHANLEWTFGWLYPVIVSPRFHRIHHSVDAASRNRNFGRLFSVWDYVFGTANVNAEEPSRFGVEGLQMPESLLPQFIIPFRALFSLLRRPSLPVAEVSPSLR